MDSNPGISQKTLKSTQAHIPIAEIANGCVILKDGSLRMVALVSSINFDLKSEKEQDALTIGYQNFLNSLTFPIQIVMQSRQINLSPYLKKLETRQAEVTNELIATEITDYKEFLEKLISVANIMTKKFFVVIPYDPPILKKESLVAQFLQGIGRQVTRVEVSDFEESYKELVQRTQLIVNGLAALELRAVQLNTRELIELFYATYNPEVSMREELKKPEEVITKRMVSKEKR